MPDTLPPLRHLNSYQIINSATGRALGTILTNLNYADTKYVVETAKTNRGSDNMVHAFKIICDLIFLIDPNYKIADEHVVMY